MIGRNDLCLCGSGKKYKKCCLNKDKVTSILNRKIELSQKYDLEITQSLFKFSRNEKFYNEYLRAKEKFFILNKDDIVNKFIDFFNTYYLYDHMTTDNKTIARLFCEQVRLNESQVDILKNKLSSYTSIYKVETINNSKACMKDLILNESIVTEDKSVIEKLKNEEIIIGRLSNIYGVNRFLDNVVSISPSIKNIIVNDILSTYESIKSSYNSLKLFLVYNNNIFYKYIQQLLEPSIAEYLREHKKNNDVASDAKQDDNCKVIELITDKIENNYLECAIDVWDSYKNSNEVKGSESGWASAVEYYVKKEKGLNVTQGEIAKKYRVSPSTLGKRFKDLKIDKSK